MKPLTILQAALNDVLIVAMTHPSSYVQVSPTHSIYGRIAAEYMQAIGCEFFRSGIETYKDALYFLVDETGPFIRGISVDNQEDMQYLFDRVQDEPIIKRLDGTDADDDSMISLEMSDDSFVSAAGMRKLIDAVFGNDTMGYPLPDEVVENDDEIIITVESVGGYRPINSCMMFTHETMSGPILIIAMRIKGFIENNKIVFVAPSDFGDEEIAQLRHKAKNKYDNAVVRGVRHVH